MSVLRLLRSALPALGLLAITSTAMAGEVVKVHTEWPEAQRNALAVAAGKAIAGLEIEWVEPDKAEMLWGVPVRILMGLARADVLEPYTPADAPLLRPSFRSADLPMRWTGLTATAPAICYNTLIGNSSFAMTEPDNWEMLAGTEFNLAYEMGRSCNSLISPPHL